MSENLNSLTGEIVSIDQTARNIGDEIVAIAHNNAAFYSSLKGDDPVTKLAVLAAMSNAVPLADNLNKPLNVVNVLVQEVSLTNENTGQTELAPRITLIDADGTAYSATSIGVFSSIKQLLAVGESLLNKPEAPIAMFALEAGVKPKRYMTLNYGKPSK